MIIVFAFVLASLLFIALVLCHALFLAVVLTACRFAPFAFVLAVLPGLSSIVLPPLVRILSRIPPLPAVTLRCVTKHSLEYAQVNGLLPVSLAMPIVRLPATVGSLLTELQEAAKLPNPDVHALLIKAADLIESLSRLPDHELEILALKESATAHAKETAALRKELSEVKTYRDQLNAYASSMAEEKSALQTRVKDLELEMSASELASPQCLCPCCFCSRVRCSAPACPALCLVLFS